MKKRRHIGNISSSKIGEDFLREITEEEFEELCDRIRQNICGVGYGGNFWVRRAKRSHYRRVVRRIKLIRHPRDEKRVYRRTRNKARKDSRLLGALYPEREKKWIQPEDREPKTVLPRLEMENFSFIDNPLSTFDRLRDIAKAEAHEFSYNLDFLDPICLDIGPYLVLGVMQQRMLPNCDGGKLSDGLGKVLPAVELDKLLAMDISKPGGGNVLPFPLKHGAGETSREDHIGVTTKQRAVDQFTNTLDGWLNTLRLRLKEEGKGHVGQIVGEAIDNAERHSDIEGKPGRWWITGFMTTRRNDNNDVTYHCHVGLLSLGCSIASSIARAPEHIQKKITPYAKRHRSRHQSRETLTTVSALQDGITRDPPGGVGMMDLFGLVSALGKTGNGVKGAVTVISGDACIIAKEPFIEPDGEPGARQLWFNNDNSVEKPPERDYVFTMPYDFPGTLVTLRFQIDPDHLKRAVGNNGNSGSKPAD